tara:strand:+ start:491 stop:754 length:264 start_codon:yes stop_codon:yes gene_type:complete
MFREFFKKNYKSRNLLSPEEVDELEQEVKRLKEDVAVREVQIIKFGRLIHEDPVNTNKYAKRITIHNRIINDNKQKINELEIKLLDK